MKFKYSNRASALITSTVGVSDLTVQLEAGGGALMPSLTTGEMFRATMVSAGGAHEIVNCTLVVADTVTVERAQEGTAAQTFPSGSRFELHMTAGLAENMLQRSGDSMLGDLDMANHRLLRADLSATPAVFTTIHTTFIRAQTTPTDQPITAAENIITIPANTGDPIDPRRPQVFGRAIINTQMFEQVVFDWYGDVNAVPTHFKLCDGTLGTPDLRGRYIRGWTETFGVGGFGGHDTVRLNPADPFGIDFGPVVDPAGSHQHDGSNVVDTTLTEAQMPRHRHNTFTRGTGGADSGGGLLGGGAGTTTDYTGGGQPHTHGLHIELAVDHVHWVHASPFFVLAKVLLTI